MSIPAPHIFSFFSGAGFLDLGFEKSGFNVSLVNEIHEPFVLAYKYSREQMKLPEPMFGYIVDSIDNSLTNVGIEELKAYANAARAEGAPLGFIGGPPCPDFSVGGKNKGRDGENGRLSQSYISLICTIKPTFFMFENVKGLWRTARHKAFFSELKIQLQNAGYVLTERLINAIEYGAAQDRDRIILFGVLRSELKNGELSDTGLQEIFPWTEQIKFPERTAFEKNVWPCTDGDVDFPIKNIEKLPKELTVQYWFDKNNVATHQNAQDFFQPRAGLAKFLSVAEGDVSKKSYKRLHRFRYSPTAAYGNNEVHIHPTEPRRISVAEALAIQSLPKEFVLPPKMTLTNKFKTIGNGVPFLAAKGLAQAILLFIQENVREVDSRKFSQSSQQATEAAVVRIHQRALWDQSSNRQRRAA